MRLKRSPLCAILPFILAGAAAAQSAAPAAGSNDTIPEKAPGITAAPSTDLSTKPGTLSDKLSDTGGVVKPTDDVDPAMHKQAPQTGTMPVIKPGTLDGGTAK